MEIQKLSDEFEDIMKENRLKKYNPIRLAKKLLKRINSLLAFIKMGWSDQDWDYSYLLQLIVWKLRKKEKYFRESNIIEDSLSLAYEIDLVATRLELYLASELLPEDKAMIDKLTQEHKDKYGEVSHSSEEITEGPHKGLFTWDYSYPDVGEDMQEEARKENFKIICMEGELSANLVKDAFDMMGKNVFKWWD